MIPVLVAVGLFAVVALFASRARAATSGARPVGTPAKPRSALDSVILDVARAEGVDPVVLKAIAAKESSFNAQAINPEKAFVLDGVRYKPQDRQGQAKLRDFVLRGGDPATLGLKPSTGIAQVKLATARFYLPGVSYQQLFDARTNLTVAARFLRDLFRKGITEESLDVYNIGERDWPKVRNLPYRDDVKRYITQYRGDF